MNHIDRSKKTYQTIALPGPSGRKDSPPPKVKDPKTDFANDGLVAAKKAKKEALLQAAARAQKKSEQEFAMLAHKNVTANATKNATGNATKNVTSNVNASGNATTWPQNWTQNFHAQKNATQNVSGNATKAWVELPDCSGAAGEIKLRADVSNATVATCKQGPGQK